MSCAFGLVAPVAAAVAYPAVRIAPVVPVVHAAPVAAVRVSACGAFW